MPNAPDRGELEAAIYRQLGLQSAHETTETLIVKVSELEPVTWPPDSKQLRAGLFLSLPFLGADRTKLDQLWPVFARASSATRSCRDGRSSYRRRRPTPTGTTTPEQCC